MKPNFTLGLLDFFVYLLPGAVLVIPLLFCDTSITQEMKLTSFEKYVLLFITSYIFGHILTYISSIIPKIGSEIKKLLKIKENEPLNKLKTELDIEFKRKLHTENFSGKLYGFSLRLVAEYCPNTHEYISRLNTMSLFSRNMIVASLVFLFIIGFQEILFVILILSISIIFILRYFKIVRSIENAVYRSAFIYLNLS